VAWDENKKYSITIDHTKVDADLSWFPVVVSLNGVDHSDFFTEISYTNRKKVAFFADGDQSTGKKCYAEIEHFDGVAKKVVYHVAVPEVSSLNDTVLYLYYDATQSDQDERTTSEAGDDFTGTNGDPPERTKWQVLGPAGYFEIQSNELHCSSSDTSVMAAMLALLKGDFQIQIDVNDLSAGTTDWNGLIFEIRDVDDLSNTLAYIQAGRHTSGGGDAWFANTKNAGSWGTGVYVSRSNNYGKLRFTRSGSNLTAEYQDGAGSWTSLFSNRTWVNADLRLDIKVNRTGGTVTGDFDNFQVNYADGLTGWIGDAEEYPATQVWDKDFVAVYHFAQDPSGGTDALKDSTTNGLHGLTRNMEAADLVDGKCGKALRFDGVNEYISVLYDALLAPTDALTGEVLAYKSNWTDTDNDRLFSKTEQGGYNIERNQSTGNIRFAVKRNNGYGFGTVSNSSLSAGWHYFMGRYDGRYAALRVDDGSLNGQNDAGATYPIQYTYTNALQIAAEAWQGETQADSRYFAGDICEMRFSDIGRSNAWGKATYYSLFDNLLTIGARTYTKPTTPSITDIWPKNTTARLYGSVFNDPDGDNHSRSQWQVDLQTGDFSAPVHDSGETTDLTNHEATGLTASTSYKARVRYKDDSGDADTQWSDWSTPVNFDTRDAWSGIFFENREPADGETQVQDGTPVKCDVKDNWYRFAEADIKILIEGEEYTSVDLETSYQTLLDGDGWEEGKRITWTPPASYEYGRGNEVNCRVDAKNSHADESYTEWKFYGFRFLSKKEMEILLSNRELSKIASELVANFRQHSYVPSEILTIFRHPTVGAAQDNEVEVYFIQFDPRKLQGEAEPTVFVCEIKRRFGEGAANVAEAHLATGQGSADIYGEYLVITGGSANLQAFSVFVEPGGAAAISVTAVIQTEGAANVAEAIRLAGEGSARIYKVEDGVFLRINALPQEVKESLQEAGVIISA